MAETSSGEQALCRCGSGLRAVRCCEIPSGGAAGVEAIALLDTQAEAAIKLFNEKRHGEAEALALKLLDLAPNHRGALSVLFELRKVQNRLDAAEALAKRMADLPGSAPAVATALSQYAQLIVSRGRYADAKTAAARALIASPKDAGAQHVMGVVLTETGQLAFGEQHYRQAVALLGREDGLVLANLAWNLKQQGRLHEATEIYRKALELRPDNKRGIGGFAQVQLGLGDVDAAIATLDKALETYPDDRTLRLLRAMADLAKGAAHSVLARLNDPVENLMTAELVTRGQAHAQLGQVTEATTHFAAAKRIHRERNKTSYDAAAYQKKFKQYQAYFTGDRLQPLPRASSPAAIQPVFLLGFPRSGTALLEQLLMHVPGFAAGDEQAPIADLVHLVPRLVGMEAKSYPNALDYALIGEGQDLAIDLRRRYIAARTALGLIKPNVPFVTDRAPSNLWHLPLIKLLFPDAPIIHMLRHPLDVLLSNFAQDQKLEGNAGVSLDAIAKHYGLSMTMIKHYRANITMRYLPVRYENLVAEPRPVLGSILAFIGGPASMLPSADELCANKLPPQDPVPAHFATRQQVHERGRYRYRDYERAMPNLFNDVMSDLRPWIEELGYGEPA